MRFLVGCVNQSDRFCGTEYIIYDASSLDDLKKRLANDRLSLREIFCVYNITGKYDLKRYL